MTANKVISEALGTFLMVFSGCGAMVVNDVHGGVLGHIGVCLVFGLIVMAMIYSIGNVSGAHINPAVTLGFMFAGRLNGRLVPPYIAGQLLGAVAAAALLRFFFPEHPTLGATLTVLPAFKAFLVEVVITFLLMFVILNVSTGHQEKGIMAGVAVGGTVALAALIGGPLTGASMNPARSLGPALVAGQLQGIWIYMAGPLLGAFLAFPFCRIIQSDNCCDEVQQLEEIQELP